MPSIAVKNASDCNVEAEILIQLLVFTKSVLDLLSASRIV